MCPSRPTHHHQHAPERVPQALTNVLAVHNASPHAAQAHAVQTQLDSVYTCAGDPYRTHWAGRDGHATTLTLANCHRAVTIQLLQTQRKLKLVTCKHGLLGCQDGCLYRSACTAAREHTQCGTGPGSDLCPLATAGHHKEAQQQLTQALQVLLPNYATCGTLHACDSRCPSNNSECNCAGVQQHMSRCLDTGPGQPPEPQGVLYINWPFKLELVTTTAEQLRC